MIVIVVRAYERFDNNIKDVDLFCLMVAGDVIRYLLCFFFLLSIVIFLYVFHLSEGMRCMLRYVYASLWDVDNVDLV